MQTRSHEPVLLEEVLTALNLQKDGKYVDATFGRGGHSRAILAQLGPDGRLLAMDRDPQACASAQQKFADDTRFAIVRGPFSMLAQTLDKHGWTGKVAGVLMDLGVSSPQLDAPERGFSFLHDGPLDMRMDPSSGVSAADWLHSAAESEIAQVIREYGEERFARRVARALCSARAELPITSTARLAQIVAAAVPTREPGQHPATRTFQAIRLHINAELDELRTALPQAMAVLAAGGRLVVISFHSLEDRIVKQFMRKQAKGDDYPPDLPVTQNMLHPKVKLIGKALRPSAAEVRRNPRARSAVLRVAEVLHG